MGTLIALSAFAITGLFILLTLTLIGFVIKAIFWVVFFPIRFLFKTVFWVLGAGLGLLVLPVVLLIAGVAIIGAIIVAILSLLAPLLPIALVALFGWAIYRASTRRPSPVI